MGHAYAYYFDKVYLYITDNTRKYKVYLLGSRKKINVKRCSKILPDLEMLSFNSPECLVGLLSWVKGLFNNFSLASSRKPERGKKKTRKRKKEKIDRR